MPIYVPVLAQLLGREFVVLHHLFKHGASSLRQLQFGLYENLEVFLIRASKESI